MVTPPFGKTVDPAIVQETMEKLSVKYGVTKEIVLASILGWFTSQKEVLSRLLQYCMDEASDEFISEEFYQRYENLLPFLAIAGSDNEEVRFRAYVHTHREIFKCKTCGHDLFGGCPIMICSNPECGKEYYVQVDNISKVVCDRCSANKIGECTEDSRNKRFKIFTC